MENKVKYALLIEYNGNGLVGWQRQEAGISVQGTLEKVANQIFNDKLHNNKIFAKFDKTFTKFDKNYQKFHRIYQNVKFHKSSQSFRKNVHSIKFALQ